MLVYLPPNARPTTDSSQTGRRASARLRVYIPGRLIMLGGNYPCALEDISQTGARVICDANIRSGETGVLQTMDIDVLCKVVRAQKGRLGLQFEEDVSAAAIRELRRQNDIYRKNRIQRDRAHAKRWATGKYD